MTVPWQINVLFVVYVLMFITNRGMSALGMWIIIRCVELICSVCQQPPSICMFGKQMTTGVPPAPVSKPVITWLCQVTWLLSLIDYVSMEIWQNNWLPIGCTRSIHRGSNIVILMQGFNLIVDMCSSSGLSSQGQEGPMRQWVFMQIKFALATVTADQWKGTCKTCCDR